MESILIVGSGGFLFVLEAKNVFDTSIPHDLNMIPRRLLENSPELGVHLCLRRLELGPSHSQLIVHCTGIDQSVNKGHALSQSIQELSLVSLWKLINPLGKYYVVDTHISIHLILSWSNRRLCYWLTLHALCHKNRL